jgi:hypothetical protein
MSTGPRERAELPGQAPFFASPLRVHSQTLHNFDSVTEGTLASGLIQASDGNFYGNVRRFGPLCGAAYRLTPAGQFAVLNQISFSEAYQALGIVISDVA